ncbi:MAG: S41 family peptidase [Terriglobia bacterium]|nr:MAG: S41 family peptidase [Terriglobia bacterium]
MNEAALMRIRITLLVALFTAGSLGLALIYAPTVHVRAATGSEDELSRGVRAIAEAYSLVEQNFADPVSSERAMYEGAIPGMLRTLDPHSNFLDPTEFRDMQRRQHAQYFGVGMEIAVDEGKIVVFQPFPGSPAWNAGLRRGDAVAAVDGRSTKGMDTADVANMLRGARGTPVSVTVERPGAPEPMTIQVIRGEIQTSVVDAYWLKPGIAYLGITTFEAENVSQDLETAIQALGEDKVQGLVLDLRGNPGGLLNEAVAVAGRYLRNGQTVVSHRGRAEQEQIFRAKAQSLGQRYPIVVLVDRRSASASEIVSGALQDHDRAWILGETTFGKGLVQGQFPLSEGAALLLTIAHYYTPSGRLIQRDYQHRSFFDYYYAGRNDGPNLQDVKATDSGRKVYGGGGIAPDEKFDPPKGNLFQRHMVVSNAFFHFGSVYFSGHTPVVAEGWSPDAETLQGFRNFLDAQEIPYTEEEFNTNRQWILDQLRWELYSRALGKKTADRAAMRSDAEVNYAIQCLPKAQALFQEAQRVIAQRRQRR